MTPSTPSEGRAWEALSYPSWGEYVRRVFDMSKVHSHRLVFLAVTQRILAEGDSNQLVTPTHESQVRALAQLDSPEEKREAWAEAVAATDGKPTARAVAAAVAKRKPRQASGRSDTLTMLKHHWVRATPEEKGQFWTSCVAKVRSSPKARAVHVIEQLELLLDAHEPGSSAALATVRAWVADNPPGNTPAEASGARAQREPTPDENPHGAQRISTTFIAASRFRTCVNRTEQTSAVRSGPHTTEHQGWHRRTAPQTEAKLWSRPAGGSNSLVMAFLF